MNYGTYFPDQRHLLSLTAIRRARVLPAEAIGEVEARTGERIDLRDVVARGSVPSRYSILEAGNYFGLRNPDDLHEKMLVEMGELVSEGQVIAGKANKRGKHILSPVNGIIAYIGEGRIIVQEIPEQVDLESGLIGQVVQVIERRGVIIETIGAVMQGVWGNGRLAIGQLRLEPEGGIEMIYSDSIDIEYRGTIVVTRRPLQEITLSIIDDQQIGGVIAPSMDSGLIDRALAVNGAILLMQGFGSARMSQYILQFLENLINKQATVDAVLPHRFESRRPEVIINLPAGRERRPTVPEFDIRLRVGMNVRMIRGTYVGVVGKVTDLPKTPQMLDNGLKVPCALVEMVTGKSTYIPIENLEVFGQ